MAKGERLNLGAHISIAGSLDQAPARGKAVGCECIQIFTKSNRQWQARPLADVEVERFKDNCRACGIEPVFGHACYLINLGASDAALRRKSRRSFALELERAERLGLAGLIAHPGAHGGAGEERGLARIAEALAELLRATAGRSVAILLETAAGGGSSLGGRFEHLAEIISRGGGDRRLGVCFDTCHVFAAGYDLRTPRACKRTFAEFDRVVGLDRLRAFHFNDSAGALGSRLDRHEHIGKGRLGLAPFRAIMRDARFRAIPKFLETPKGMRGKRQWDEVSLSLLRGLARHPAGGPRADR